MSNAGISCDRVRRPGGPARRVLRRRRDGSGRQLHAELEISPHPTNAIGLCQELRLALKPSSPP